jgi:hypothetical protein
MHQLHKIIWLGGGHVCTFACVFPDPKIGALQKVPQEQNDNFLENVSNAFDQISVICGDHLPK